MPSTEAYEWMVEPPREIDFSNISLVYLMISDKFLLVRLVPYSSGFM